MYIFLPSRTRNFISKIAARQNWTFTFVSNQIRNFLGFANCNKFYRFGKISVKFRGSELYDFVIAVSERGYLHPKFGHVALVGESLNHDKSLSL